MLKHHTYLLLLFMSLAIIEASEKKFIKRNHVKVKPMNVLAKGYQKYQSDIGTSKLAPRIVNGVEVDPPGKYPWMVSIRDSFSHFCGASLIAPNIVLSAAHCQFFKASVALGVHDQNDSDDVEEFEVFLEDTVIHPEYNDDTLDNDIMLIKLMENVENYESIKSNDGSLNTDDLEVTVAGWGTTSSGGVASDVLLEADVDVYEESLCAEYLQSIGYDPTGKICAARPQTDSCQGDSGGPLFHTNENNSTYTQVGIVSFGFGCAHPDNPGIYTDVGAYYWWMVEVICNGEDALSPNSPFCTLPRPSLSPTISNVPTSEPSVSSRPTISSPPTLKCFDLPGWITDYGDCEYYNDYPENCELFIHFDVDENGVNALEACCACNGGVQQFTSSQPTVSSSGGNLTSFPSQSPSVSPTKTVMLTSSPSHSPSVSPSSRAKLTSFPSLYPSLSPTIGAKLTSSPSQYSSLSPTKAFMLTSFPSQSPSVSPSSEAKSTSFPSQSPLTSSPSQSPSMLPSLSPTNVSITSSPSQSPSLLPSLSPSSGSKLTSFPSQYPSLSPTNGANQTSSPSQYPSLSPTNAAKSTSFPSQSPSLSPSSGAKLTSSPSQSPSLSPSLSPSSGTKLTSSPSQSPSLSPSSRAKLTSSSPSQYPSLSSTNGANLTPSPSESPSLYPSSRDKLTSSPSQSPSLSLSLSPTNGAKLTSYPSQSPSLSPTNGKKLTSSPSQSPSLSPSNGAKLTSFPSQSPSKEGHLTSYPSKFPSIDLTTPSVVANFTFAPVVSTTSMSPMSSPAMSSPAMSSPNMPNSCYIMKFSRMHTIVVSMIFITPIVIF